MKHLVSLLLTILLSQLTFAQLTSLPYSCGFEDSTENCRWTINAGPSAANLTNKWYVSDANPFAGSNALIISDDQGLSCHYSNIVTCAVSYRMFRLPAGSYNLSFTYKAGGEAANDGLYVCWTNGSLPTNSSLFQTPAWVDNNAVSFNGTKMLNLTGGWKVASNTITFSGDSMKLVFVWVNNGSVSFAPGAIIDNVQITSTGCTPPSNISASVSGLDINVSWSGNASSYDFMYRRQGSDFTTISGITSNSYTIQNNSEGVYDFMVRSNCTSDTSEWVLHQNVLVCDSSARCINYLNLSAPGTTCYYGNYSNPKQCTGIVDEGPYSINSRHTIHFDHSETDPRTLNELHTVPEGELASVRLGNWNIGNEAEAITYTYQVPTGSDNIIILNHAVLLDNPTHSNPPIFSIGMTDYIGRHIGAYWGAIWYEYDTIPTGPLWHTNLSTEGSPIVWREWDKVGFNVSQYAGQTIKFTLTTRDCDFGGHFGYAYFTLACTSAELTGSYNDSTQSTLFTAPDGFTYSWSKKGTGELVSTGQSFSISDSDTTIYICTYTSKVHSAYSYTLTASRSQHIPQPQFSYSIDSSDCQSHISFLNSSSVFRLENGDTIQCPEKSITSQQWTVRSRHAARPYHNMVSDSLNLQQLDIPKEGDTIQVTLKTWYDSSERDTTVTIAIPALHDDITIIDRQVCIGYSVSYKDKLYTFISRDSIEVVNADSSIYFIRDTMVRVVDSLANHYGCDSIEMFTLTLITPDTVSIDTVVKAGVPFRFTVPYAGDPYSIAFDTTILTDGVYLLRIPSTLQCDSFFIRLNVVFDEHADLEIIDGTSLEIFLTPNPIAAGESVTVSFNTTISLMELYDFNGRVIQRITSPISPIRLTPISAPGLYFVRVTDTAGNTSTHRLLVK